MSKADPDVVCRDGPAFDNRKTFKEILWELFGMVSGADDLVGLAKYEDVGWVRAALLAVVDDGCMMSSLTRLTDSNDGSAGGSIRVMSGSESSFDVGTGRLFEDGLIGEDGGDLRLKKAEMLGLRGQGWLFRGHSD